MECYGKVQRNLPRQAPSYESKIVLNQCVLPAMIYGCQRWSLAKPLVKKLETRKRAMERRKFNVSLNDRIRNRIRQRTRVTDIVQYVTNTKWKWAGHIARMTDNRRTIRSTEWQTEGVRSVSRPKRRWRDDIVVQQGAVWTRIAKGRERLWRKATSRSGRTQPRIEENRSPRLLPFRMHTLLSIQILVNLRPFFCTFLSIEHRLYLESS